MIKPTIGRVVWYWPSAQAAAIIDAQPYAALVVCVHNEYSVNLAVFDRNGDLRPAQRVPLSQHGEVPNEGPYCEWMPYQKGQAAKAETPPMEIFAKVESLMKKVAELEGYIAKNILRTNVPGLTPPPPPTIGA